LLGVEVMICAGNKEYAAQQLRPTNARDNTLTMSPEHVTVPHSRVICVSGNLFMVTLDVCDGHKGRAVRDDVGIWNKRSVLAPMTIRAKRSPYSGLCTPHNSRPAATSVAVKSGSMTRIVRQRP